MIVNSTQWIINANPQSQTVLLSPGCWDIGFDVSGFTDPGYVPRIDSVRNLKPRTISVKNLTPKITHLED